MAAKIQKLKNIQALRGVAALLVVFAHLIVIETKYAGDTVLSPAFNMGMVGVDLFFVISGFIMVYVTAGTHRGFGAATGFLFARVTRIYPLYWLVSLSLLALWLVRPDLVFSSFQTPPDIAKSFLLWPDSRAPLLAVGWTLVHEMFFYLVFCLSLLIKRSALPIFLLCWVLAVVVGERLGIRGINPVLGVIFSPLTLEFVGGAFAAWLLLRGSARFGKSAIAIGIASIVIAVVVFTPQAESIFADHWNRVAVFLVPSMLIIYGGAAVETFGVAAPTWAVRVGDSSYSLYLTHVLSLTILGYIWRVVAREGIADNLLALPVLVLGAVAIGLATWWLFEMPILKISRWWRRSLPWARAQREPETKPTNLGQ